VYWKRRRSTGEEEGERIARTRTFVRARASRTPTHPRWLCGCVRMTCTARQAVGGSNNLFAHKEEVNLKNM
jgi:hypothetical protein